LVGLFIEIGDIVVYFKGNLGKGLEVVCGNSHKISRDKPVKIYP